MIDVAPELLIHTGRRSMTTMEGFGLNGTRGLSLPFFLAGMGTGVALTLLLAPLSGEATRNLIRRKVKEGADWAKDTAAGAEESG